MKVIITTRLSRRVCRGQVPLRLISFRRLSKKEILMARKFNVGRFYLPAIGSKDTEEFLGEFDGFWDEVVSGFPPEHPFWRNVVSSKMQPWENSIGYLCLVLFTLACTPASGDAGLVIVCDSVQMRRVFIEWARINRWELISTGSAQGGRVDAIAQKINNLGWFAVRFLSCLYKKWFSPSVKAGGGIRGDTALISSFYYPSSFRNGSYHDPFLGNLHDFLKKNGMKCVYLCEPLNEFDKNTVQKTSHCQDTKVYTTYSLIKWREMILALIGLYFRDIRVSEVKFMGCDMSKLIRWYAGNFINSFNIGAEIRFKAAERLCSLQKFDRLIYGFEENVHERACIQAFRRLGHGKIIGYSHAVIYPLNLKIRLTGKEALLKPGPDAYVCTGPYAKKLLQKVGVRYPSQKMTDGCIIKDIPEISKKNGAGYNRRRILVALDGMESSIVLLEWILEHLKMLDDFIFCLRFHPNVPAKRIVSQCINRIPDNVEISNNSLMQDIEGSLCVLYRHSSVGMQALLNGVPAVYLGIDSPLHGDPLDEFTTYKWSVYSVSELAAALEEIKSSAPEQSDELPGAARKFLQGYFAAPSEGSLKSFID